MKLLKHLFPALFLLMGTPLFSQTEIQLEEFASGFTNVVKITHAGDDRLFVVERSGRIKILDNTGATLPTPFLDIDARVAQTGGQSEQGLLGLAFHPDYATNGFFYVNYINNDGNTVVARYSVTADPNVADPNSEFPIIGINQPFGNHNGGEIEFGPDGYLYIGMGDGGSGNDPGHRAQNTQSLHGKMLRIDVSQEPYTIPADNPFVDSIDVLDEIWAIGLRNPWRFSFDKLTGDLWIADVGQWDYEEIDFQPASSTGGENYGWRCREGSVDNPNVGNTGCGPLSDYVQPIFEYPHSQFGPCSITGGFVYRGCLYPPLQGYYFYADFCSGDIWGLKRDANGNVDNQKLETISNGAWTTFGQDINGEIYISGLNSGKIFQITSGQPLINVSIINDDGVLSVDQDFDSYQWYLNGNPISGATAATYTAEESGEYSLQVVLSGGCTYGSDQVTVVITGTDQIKGLQNFSVQPNPFEDYFNLQLKTDHSDTFQLKVFSLDGRIVFEKELKRGTSWDEKIDLGKLESAVYLLQISNGKEEMVKRIVKK